MVKVAPGGQVVPAVKEAQAVQVALRGLVTTLILHSQKASKARLACMVPTETRALVAFLAAMVRMDGREGKEAMGGEATALPWWMVRFDLKARD